MPLQKIKFEINLPVEVALRFTEGKLCDSKFGDPQYMFTTIDDRVFYLDEKVAQKIHGMRLQPGELIDIGKAEVDYGNGRKGVEWQIARVGAVGEQPDGTFKVPAAAVGKTAAPGSTAATQPASSTSLLNTRNGISKANGNGHNGNGHTTPWPEDVPMPWAQFTMAMARQLIDCEAILIQWAMEKHGGLVKPEHVHALLSTAFINVSKNGGVHVA